MHTMRTASASSTHSSVQLFCVREVVSSSEVLRTSQFKACIEYLSPIHGADRPGLGCGNGLIGFVAALAAHALPCGGADPMGVIDVDRHMSGAAYEESGCAKAYFGKRPKGKEFDNRSHTS